MVDPTIAGFVSGALAAGFLIIAAFFLRFWTKTGDILFLTFSAAFCLMSLVHMLPVLLGIPVEERSGVYLLRAAAFALIIVAVLMKNLGRRGDGAS